MKTCEHCTEPAIVGERFCKGCKIVAIKQMRDSGYLSATTYKTPSDQIGRKSVSTRVIGGAPVFHEQDDE